MRKIRDVRARPSGPSVSRMLPEKAEGRTVRISELAAGGDGFASLEGQPVFVSLSAPGDLLTLSRVHTSRGVLFARPGKLLTPSPLRRTPPCPWFGECGGCSWQHLPYPVQVDWKTRLLVGTLARVGGISLPKPPATEVSKEEFGWRTRIRLHFREGRLGFFRRGTHSVVEWERCLLLPEVLNRAVWLLRDLLARFPRREAVLAVEMTAADAVPGLSLLWRTRRETDVRERRVLVERAGNVLAPFGLPLSQGVALEEALLPLETEGPPLRIRSGSRAVAFASPGVFTQVNPAQNVRLVDQAVGWLAGRGVESLLDLYCGNGNFALAAAASGMRVRGVDSHPGAVSDAVAAAAAAGLPAEFLPIAAEEYARRGEGREGGREFDAVILDPPRTGIPAFLRRSLARGGMKTILSVSCNPATAARDLGHLIALGYRLEAFSAFDLFPQTPHLETLALLVRD